MMIASADTVQSISCPCRRNHEPVNKSIVKSTCGEGADSRGSGQNVVVYTLFGHPERDDQVRKRYFTSLDQRAARVAQAYPGK